MVTLASHNFTAYGLASLRDEYFRARKVGLLLSFGALFLVVEERVNTLTRLDESVQVPLVDLVEGMSVPDIFVVPITHALALRHLKRFLWWHRLGIRVHEV